MFVGCHVHNFEQNPTSLRDADPKPHGRDVGVVWCLWLGAW